MIVNLKSFICRKEIFEFLQTQNDDDTMAREYLSVLFGLETEPMTAEHKVLEEISVEEMLKNGFKDFRHWYAR